MLKQHKAVKDKGRKSLEGEGGLFPFGVERQPG